MKRSPLLILFCTIFIDLLGFGLLIPQIPNFIKHYGGTPVVGGWLLACYSVMQFVFAPIWGKLSDTHGRRPMILIGLIGSAISFFAFGAAGSLVFLFVARVAAGALTAASLPTAQAYIADVTPPEKRAGGMAMIGAAFGLGFAFGPFLGAKLSQYPVFGFPGLSTPAFFAGSLALINFVFALFMLPESHTDRAPASEHRTSPREVFGVIGKAMRNPVIASQLTVYAFTTFAFAAVESSFTWLVLLRFHLNEKSAPPVTGVLFGIIGLTALITQLLVMGGLARKVGEHRLVMLGSLILVASLIAVAFANSIPLMKIVAATIAVGNGVMNPSLSALITHSAGPADRGSVSGAQQGLGSLARIFAPPVNNRLVMVQVGSLIGAIPFLFSAVLMLIAFGLSLRLSPMPAKQASAEPNAA